ncbi:MAG: lipopolysaccharide biosynthesis protein, partial [Candidatus Nanopelagicales bacterium]
MSVINKYIKNASWYVFGSAVQGLTPFLLTPVLTRTLSQEQFSDFVLFISIGTVLSFLFALGLPAALTRELILDKNNSKDTLLSVNLVKRYLLLIALSL